MCEGLRPGKPGKNSCHKYSLTDSIGSDRAPADTVRGYEAGSWFGIGAPKGTPESVLDKLNKAVNAAFENADIRARLADLGATAMPGSPGQFATIIAQETERYASVIRTAKISAK